VFVVLLLHLPLLLPLLVVVVVLVLVLVLVLLVWLMFEDGEVHVTPSSFPPGAAKIQSMKKPLENTRKWIKKT